MQILEVKDERRKKISHIIYEICMHTYLIRNFNLIRILHADLCTFIRYSIVDKIISYESLIFFFFNCSSKYRGVVECEDFDRDFFLGIILLFAHFLLSIVRDTSMTY